LQAPDRRAGRASHAVLAGYYGRDGREALGEGRREARGTCADGGGEGSCSPGDEEEAKGGGLWHTGRDFQKSSHWRQTTLLTADDVPPGGTHFSYQALCQMLRVCTDGSGRGIMPSTNDHRGRTLQNTTVLESQWTAGEVGDPVVYAAPAISKSGRSRGVLDTARGCDNFLFLGQGPHAPFHDSTAPAHHRLR
jgi:hypothetical protein